MANIFNVNAAHKGQKLPLRGDMDGALLNLVPGDNKFPIRFFTEDAKQYTITALTEFRVKGAVTSNKSFTFGGKPGLWVEFIYEPTAGVWVMTTSNLEAAGVGGGSAIATTFSVLSTTTGAAGTPASVEIVGGSTANVQFKFTIPQGVAGAAGSGGSGGSGTTLPTPTKVGDVLTATGTSAGQYSWITPAASSSGGGVGFTPEVLLTQNAQGEITLDRSLGNNFRVMLTMNGKMKNPVGFVPGERILVAVRQGPTGPFTLDWELNWAHPDRQVPKLATQPGGLNVIDAYLTEAINAANPGGWVTNVDPKSSTIGYGVPSFVARNVQTGIEYYVLRSATQLAGTTEMRAGQTLKILRNGLGIEAYGAIDGSVNGAGNYLITGALPNSNRAELRTGPGVRSAFDRGVLAFGGNGVNATIQDIILSGAREQSGTARIAQGVSLTGGANVTLKNVRLYDNENGILSSNDYTGTLAVVDCEFDMNAVGDDGFTHNIYMGHHNQGWSALRTTFKNAVLGHNIKSRAGVTTLNQVHCYSSYTGREFDVPNGGVVNATDCIFEKSSNFQQNDLVRIVEGFDLDTARPRQYTFRNCKFISTVGNGAAGSYVWNNDPDVDVVLIDCLFEGAKGPGTAYPPGSDSLAIWPGTDTNGNRGRVVLQTTGGPLGPRVPVGYQSIAVTPVAG